MSARSRKAILAVAGLGCAIIAVGPGILAAEHDLAVSLGFGHDSNPDRLSVEPRSGAFAELDVAASLRARPEKRAQLFARLHARQRDHESSAATADATSASLTAGLALVARKRASSSVVVLVGGKLRARRSTFVDPTTGEVFAYEETLPGGGTATTPAPERFDSDIEEGFVKLRWKPSRRWQLGLDASARQRDYVEDYEAVAGVEPLDYGAETIEPGLRVRFGDAAALTVSYSSTRRTYDVLPAADESGNGTTGVLREYRYDGYRISLTVEPAESVTLRLGARAVDRSDLYAGYYDSDTRSLYLSVEAAPGPKHALQFSASLLDLGYANATVANDPNADFRGFEVLTAQGRYERALTEKFTLFAVLGGQRADDRDPAFTYDREWVSSGVKFQR